MRVALAADHAGFELKEQLVRTLKEWGFEVSDFGATNYDKFDDYPDFAERVAQAVQSGTAERGVLVCGSGVGVCVTANKFKGVRAAICHDVYSAKQGVQHDSINVICLGALVVEKQLAFELVRAFLDAEFIDSEEKFVRRLNKVNAIEQRNGL